MRQPPPPPLAAERQERRTEGLERRRRRMRRTGSRRDMSWARQVCFFFYIYIFYFTNKDLHRIHVPWSHHPHPPSLQTRVGGCVSPRLSTTPSCPLPRSKRKTRRGFYRFFFFTLLHETCLTRLVSLFFSLFILYYKGSKRNAFRALVSFFSSY